MKLDSGAFKGSYPPVVTPFKDGRLDLDTYAALLERQVREGSHGVVITGTSGEPSSLTLAERSELLKVAVKTVAGRIPVVAATGSQSYSESRQLTQRAEKIGADALLIVTPYYIKPPQAGLCRYFTGLAEVTSLPWMIYHIPGRAAVSIQAETVARIAEESHNLVGMKHAVNDLDFVTEILARLGRDFRIFCGLESLSLPMLAVGGAGLMNAVGNLAPARVARLCEALAAGHLREARDYHFELFELNRAIFLTTNPIPLKYMMHRLGLIPSPEVRLPLCRVNSDQAQALDGVLCEAGLMERAQADCSQ